MKESLPQWRDIYILQKDFMDLRAGESFIVRDVCNDYILISREDYCRYDCVKHNFQLHTFLDYFKSAAHQFLNKK